MAAQTMLYEAAPAPPSIRQQLQYVLALYQTLTNVYFLLIEYRASTSTSSVRKSLLAQVDRLRSQYLHGIQDEGSASSAATAYRGANREQGRGLSSLRPEHAERIEALTVFQELALGSASTSQSFAVHALQKLNEVSEAVRGIDALLADMMQRARTHAANQARIEALVADVKLRDSQMVTTIRRLSVLKERCQRLCTLGQEEETSIRHAERFPLQYHDILRYARTLSQTTTAPPGFTLPPLADDDGQPPQTQAQPEADKPALYAKDTVHELAGGQVPAHLQDKLPFPSVDAIRRGASEVRMPTWAMFQRGILQPTTDAETAEAAEAAQATRDADAGADVAMDEAHEQQERQKRAQAAAQQQQQQQQQRTAKPAPPAPPPMEQDDDGFGLDLN